MRSHEKELFRDVKLLLIQTLKRIFDEINMK
jgi:hypothetical protein